MNREPPSSWVLASASPRRLRFLRAIGFDCVVDPAHVEEIRLPGEPPEVFVRRAAFDKLAEVQPRHLDAAVIAADTIVVVGNDVLGKPADDKEAEVMLRRLSGRWHRVLTAVALGTSVGSASREVESLVKFRSLSVSEIQFYVRSGEPRDKAGAYGLQGLGSMIVERIDGSCSNVAGFPLEALFSLVGEMTSSSWTRFAAVPDLAALWP
ncbi:septum formation protein Maf [Candidatus Fermentibacteria bacterium]|nr:septum formation protein Maf [Candidatus Fermentibacteria bacterium]